MSDTVTTTEEASVVKRYFHPNPKFSWAAAEDFKYGAVEAGEIEIESTITGRFDLWKVPVSEANPDGLWANMFNGQFYEGVEPGVESWNKQLLAKISFIGYKRAVTTDEDDRNSNSGGSNGIDFVDADFNSLLDLSQLTPAPVELPSINDSSVNGEAGTYVDLDVQFSGDTVSGTWTFKITPTGCSIKGLTGEPDTVINSGETKTYTGTMQEMNAEIEHAQILIGETDGSVRFEWDHDQTGYVFVDVNATIVG